MKKRVNIHKIILIFLFVIFLIGFLNKNISALLEDSNSPLDALSGLNTQEILTKGISGEDFIKLININNIEDLKRDIKISLAERPREYTDIKRLELIEEQFKLDFINATNIIEQIKAITNKIDKILMIIDDPSISLMGKNFAYELLASAYFDRAINRANLINIGTGNIRIKLKNFEETMIIPGAPGFYVRNKPTPIKLKTEIIFQRDKNNNIIGARKVITKYRPELIFWEKGWIDICDANMLFQDSACKDVVGKKEYFMILSTLCKKEGDKSYLESLFISNQIKKLSEDNSVDEVFYNDMKADFDKSIDSLKKVKLFGPIAVLDYKTLKRTYTKLVDYNTIIGNYKEALYFIEQLNYWKGKPPDFLTLQEESELLVKEAMLIRFDENELHPLEKSLQLINKAIEKNPNNQKALEMKKNLQYEILSIIAAHTRARSNEEINNLLFETESIIDRLRAMTYDLDFMLSENKLLSDESNNQVQAIYFLTWAVNDGFFVEDFYKDITEENPFGDMFSPHNLSVKDMIERVLRDQYTKESAREIITRILREKKYISSVSDKEINDKVKHYIFLLSNLIEKNPDIALLAGGGTDDFMINQKHQLAILLDTKKNKFKKYKGAKIEYKRVPLRDSFGGTVWTDEPVTIIEYDDVYVKNFVSQCQNPTSDNYFMFTIKDCKFYKYSGYTTKTWSFWLQKHFFNIFDLGMFELFSYPWAQIHGKTSKEVASGIGALAGKKAAEKATLTEILTVRYAPFIKIAEVSNLVRARIIGSMENAIIKLGRESAGIKTTSKIIGGASEFAFFVGSSSVVHYLGGDWIGYPFDFIFMLPLAASHLDSRIIAIGQLRAGLSEISDIKQSVGAGFSFKTYIKPFTPLEQLSNPSKLPFEAFYEIEVPKAKFDLTKNLLDSSTHVKKIDLEEMVFFPVDIKGDILHSFPLYETRNKNIIILRSKTDPQITFFELLTKSLSSGELQTKLKDNLFDLSVFKHEWGGKEFSAFEFFRRARLELKAQETLFEVETLKKEMKGVGILGDGLFKIRRGVSCCGSKFYYIDEVIGENADFGLLVDGEYFILVDKNGYAKISKDIEGLADDLKSEIYALVKIKIEKGNAFDMQAVGGLVDYTPREREFVFKVVEIALKDRGYQGILREKQPQVVNSYYDSATNTRLIIKKENGVDVPYVQIEIKDVTISGKEFFDTMEIPLYNYLSKKDSRRTFANREKIVTVLPNGDIKECSNYDNRWGEGNEWTIWEGKDVQGNDVTWGRQGTSDPVILKPNLDTSAPFFLHNRDTGTTYVYNYMQGRYVKAIYDEAQGFGIAEIPFNGKIEQLGFDSNGRVLRHLKESDPKLVSDLVSGKRLYRFGGVYSNVLVLDQDNKRLLSYALDTVQEEFGLALGYRKGWRGLIIPLKLPELMRKPFYDPKSGEYWFFSDEDGILKPYRALVYVPRLPKNSFAPGKSALIYKRDSDYTTMIKVGDEGPVVYNPDIHGTEFEDFNSGRRMVHTSNVVNINGVILPIDDLIYVADSQPDSMLFERVFMGLVQSGGNLVPSVPVTFDFETGRVFVNEIKYKNGVAVHRVREFDPSVDNFQGFRGIGKTQVAFYDPASMEFRILNPHSEEQMIIDLTNHRVEIENRFTGARRPYRNYKPDNSGTGAGAMKKNPDVSAEFDNAVGISRNGISNLEFDDEIGYFSIYKRETANGFEQTVSTYKLNANTGLKELDQTFSGPSAISDFFSQKNRPNAFDRNRKLFYAFIPDALNPNKGEAILANILHVYHKVGANGESRIVYINPRTYFVTGAGNTEVYRMGDIMVSENGADPVRYNPSAENFKLNDGQSYITNDPLDSEKRFRWIIKQNKDTGVFYAIHNPEAEAISKFGITRVDQLEIERNIKFLYYKNFQHGLNKIEEYLRLKESNANPNNIMVYIDLPSGNILFNDPINGKLMIYLESGPSAQIAEYTGFPNAFLTVDSNGKLIVNYKAESANSFTTASIDAWDSVNKIGMFSDPYSPDLMVYKPGVNAEKFFVPEMQEESGIGLVFLDTSKDVNFGTAQQDPSLWKLKVINKKTKNIVEKYQGQVNGWSFDATEDLITFLDENHVGLYRNYKIKTSKFRQAKDPQAFLNNYFGTSVKILTKDEVTGRILFVDPNTNKIYNYNTDGGIYYYRPAKSEPEVFLVKDSGGYKVYINRDVNTPRTVSENYFDSGSPNAAHFIEGNIEIYDKIRNEVIYTDPFDGKTYVHYKNYVLSLSGKVLRSRQYPDFSKVYFYFEDINNKNTWRIKYLREKKTGGYQLDDIPIFKLDGSPNAELIDGFLSFERSETYQFGSQMVTRTRIVREDYGQYLGIKRPIIETQPVVESIGKNSNPFIGNEYVVNYNAKTGIFEMDGSFGEVKLGISYDQNGEYLFVSDSRNGILDEGRKKIRFSSNSISMNEGDKASLIQGNPQLGEILMADYIGGKITISNEGAIVGLTNNGQIPDVSLAAGQLSQIFGNKRGLSLTYKGQKDLVLSKTSEEGSVRIELFASDLSELENLRNTLFNQAGPIGFSPINPSLIQKSFDRVEFYVLADEKIVTEAGENVLKKGDAVMRAGISTDKGKYPVKIIFDDSSVKIKGTSVMEQIQENEKKLVRWLNGYEIFEGYEFGTGDIWPEYPQLENLVKRGFVSEDLLYKFSTTPSPIDPNFVLISIDQYKDLLTKIPDRIIIDIPEITGQVAKIVPEDFLFIDGKLIINPKLEVKISGASLDVRKIEADVLSGEKKYVDGKIREIFSENEANSRAVPAISRNRLKPEQIKSTLGSEARASIPIPVFDNPDMAMLDFRNYANALTERNVNILFADPLIIEEEDLVYLSGLTDNIEKVQQVSYSFVKNYEHQMIIGTGYSPIDPFIFIPNEQGGGTMQVPGGIYVKVTDSQGVTKIYDLMGSGLSSYPGLNNPLLGKAAEEFKRIFVEKCYEQLYRAHVSTYEPGKLYLTPWLVNDGPDFPSFLRWLKEEFFGSELKYEVISEEVSDKIRTRKVDSNMINNIEKNLDKADSLGWRLINEGNYEYVLGNPTLASSNLGESVAEIAYFQYFHKYIMPRYYKFPKSDYKNIIVGGVSPRQEVSFFRRIDGNNYVIKPKYEGTARHLVADTVKKYYSTLNWRLVNEPAKRNQEAALNFISGIVEKSIREDMIAISMLKQESGFVKTASIFWLNNDYTKLIERITGNPTHELGRFASDDISQQFRRGESFKFFYELLLENYEVYKRNNEYLMMMGNSQLSLDNLQLVTMTSYHEFEFYSRILNRQRDANGNIIQIMQDIDNEIRGNTPEAVKFRQDNNIVEVPVVQPDGSITVNLYRDLNSIAMGNSQDPWLVQYAQTWRTENGITLQNGKLYYTDNKGQLIPIDLKLEVKFGLIDANKALEYFRRIVDIF